jgi:protein-S-isoprenylcysteine O-methyltransferase Ste14
MRDPHPHYPVMSGRQAPSGRQSLPGQSGLPDRVHGWLPVTPGTRGWASLQRTASGYSPGPGAERFIRIAVNLAGVVTAALFAQASVRFYLHTHRLIGGLFIIEQVWFAVAFLTRRAPHAVSRRTGSWLAAFGGTFGGLLLRPGGAHPWWGVEAGFGLQVGGLLIAITSLAALGRSFGLVAADRGLKTQGPYALVRHPIYASYLLIQSGYVLQSWSLRNIAVVAFATACNVGRAMAEERLLTRSPAYRAYQQRVRWRMIPYLW